jgi:DinB superfamily
MGTATLLESWFGEGNLKGTGYGTIVVFTFLIMLVIYLSARYIERCGKKREEIDDGDIILMLLCFNIIIHSWAFYVWWAVIDNFTSDDEVILAAIITFPVSSLFSVFFGMWIDYFKNIHTVPANRKILITNLNATIDRWIAAIDQYTFEEICTQPSAGSWSMGQLYNHLIADTGFFADQIRECMQSTQHADEQPNEQGAAMLAANTFPDIKIEGNPANAEIPQPQSIEQLQLGLQGIRATLNDLFKRTCVQEAQGKSKHPGLGYFTADQWFQFADMHFRHHFRQKQRIDSFLGKI